MVAIYFFGCWSSQACELTFGWEPWPPYTLMGENNEVAGVDGELLTAIADRMGCRINWMLASWKRQLQALQAGDYDAILGASYTDERAGWGRFSDPYRQDATHLVPVKPLEGVYASLEDFLDAGKVIGVVSGYYFGKTAMSTVEQAKYRRQVRATFAAEANMRKLGTGRVDGVIMERFVATHLKHQLGFADKVASQTIPLNTENLHVLFSKASIDEDIVKQFNQALADLRADGTVERIYDKYSRYAAPK